MGLADADGIATILSVFCFVGVRVALGLRGRLGHPTRALC